MQISLYPFYFSNCSPRSEANLSRRFFPLQRFWWRQVSLTTHGGKVSPLEFPWLSNSSADRHHRASSSLLSALGNATLFRLGSYVSRMLFCTSIFKAPLYPPTLPLKRQSIKSKSVITFLMLKVISTSIWWGLTVRKCHAPRQRLSSWRFLGWNLLACSGGLMPCSAAPWQLSRGVSCRKLLYCNLEKLGVFEVSLNSCS